MSGQSACPWCVVFIYVCKDFKLRSESLVFDFACMLALTRRSEVVLGRRAKLECLHLLGASEIWQCRFAGDIAISIAMCARASEQIPRPPVAVALAHSGAAKQTLAVGYGGWCVAEQRNEKRGAPRAHASSARAPIGAHRHANSAVCCLHNSRSQPSAACVRGRTFSGGRG